MLCNELNTKISAAEGLLVESQTELAQLIKDRNAVQRIERSLANLEGQRKVQTLVSVLNEEFKPYKEKYAKTKKKDKRFAPQSL